jgi:hypothetical protein
MLRRKYYAQRNTSRGPMNTHAVTQSSSTRSRNLLRCCAPVAKQMPNRSASSKTELDKLDTLRCTTSIPTTKTSQGCKSINSCYVVKEPIGKKSSSEQVVEYKSAEVCSKENFWGKIPPMNNCAHT